ncbi:MAG: hypothetical protein ACLQE9_13725 [Roseiarcus sp.]
MPRVYNDEEIDEEDEQSDASKRLAAVTEQVNKALEDALQVTQNASRYLPWLLIVGTASTVIAAAAIAYGVVALLLHTPPAAP